MLGVWDLLKEIIASFLRDEALTRSAGLHNGPVINARRRSISTKAVCQLRAGSRAKSFG